MWGVKSGAIVLLKPEHPLRRPICRRVEGEGQAVFDHQTPPPILVANDNQMRPHTPNLKVVMRKWSQ